jgi:hypothetical protein
VSHTEIQASTTNQPVPCMKTEGRKVRVTIDPTHPRADEQRTTALAAALYIAQYGYKLATASPNPAARLDDMCDAVAETWDEITPRLPKKFAGADLEFAETMQAAVADRLWAFTVIEYARADVGQNFGYVFDLIADNLKAGAEPQSVRDEVARVAARLRVENAVSAATDAIRAAVTMSLAGLTTNPRDVAEQLHQAIEDAQAVHLARVGGVSLEEAEAAEAFSTADSAMARALRLSLEPEGTAQGLRTALRMAIDEARP